MISTMRGATAIKLLGYTLALLALLAVFSLYLRPEFMVSLAQQVWACF